MLFASFQRYTLLRAPISHLHLTPVNISFFGTLQRVVMDGTVNVMAGRQEQIRLKSDLTTSKKKDPNAPKKSKSAYTFFLQESHARIKDSNQDIPFGEVSKQISAEWKAMPEAQKRRYVELSQLDKVRYAKEKADYIPSGGNGDEGEVLKKRTRAKRSKSLPKKPCTAYVIFCTRMRPVIVDENPNIHNSDIMKETGRRWKSLTVEQQLPWQELAAEDKVRYEQEMDAYRMEQTE